MALIILTGGVKNPVKRHVASRCLVKVSLKLCFGDKVPTTQERNFIPVYVRET